jgi:hypothetical protein
MIPKTKKKLINTSTQKIHKRTYLAHLVVHNPRQLDRQSHGIADASNWPSRSNQLWFVNIWIFDNFQHRPDVIDTYELNKLTRVNAAGNKDSNLQFTHFESKLIDQWIVKNLSSRAEVKMLVL